MPDVMIEKLVKEYNGVRASDAVDLSIDHGEFVTLLGPSGCGKTTLLRCIAGLERPDSGRITLGDRVVADPVNKVLVPPHRRQLGMVFQSYALWPHLSVRGNVAYPLKRQGRSRGEIEKRVQFLLEAVGLDGLNHRQISELSGGQQQRVALARALAIGSDLVLYDEPLSNLDAGMRLSMRDQIRAIHDEMGTTSVFVTHDQEEALALSDRVVVMSHGKVVQSGTPHEVFTTPRNEFVARFLGFENVVDAHTESTADGPALFLNGGRLRLDQSISDAGFDGVAIKATHVRIGSAVQPADGGVMSGRVRTRTYVGDRTEYVVDVEGLDVRVVVLNHLAGSDLPSEGALTPIQFPSAFMAALNSSAAAMVPVPIGN